MKKIISTIALISSLSINAQTTVTLSELKNTSWKIERNGRIDPEDMYSFNGEKILWYSFWGNSKELRFTYKYYLTSTLPTKYDSSKVGKSTRGCYIVRYNPKWDSFIYYIIKTFDKSTGTMILLPRALEEPIGGMAKEIKYKLVK